MQSWEDGGQSARELVREANHRIANQLSMLIGMIQIQIEGLKNGPEQLPRHEVQELLRTTSARIFAMGNLNRHLASATGEEIDLCSLLSVTRAELVASLGANARVKACENLGQDCLVSGEQATVLCLVISEIIVNALKHAHPADHPLVLTLNCAREDEGVVLELADDGVGLPADFDESRQGRVGFHVMRSLLRQIGAELHIQDAGPGLKFRIALPKAQPRLI